MSRRCVLCVLELKLNASIFLYISIGPAYRQVSDFQLLDHVQTPDKTAVEFRMRNMVESLDLGIRYWIGRDEAARGTVSAAARILCCQLSRIIIRAWLSHVSSRMQESRL